MKKGIIVIMISFLFMECNSTKSFIKKAESLKANGQYEDALFNLKKSFDLKADEATGRKIANTYFELRNFNQAEFWYKWIRLNSDFSVADYYTLAEILIGNSKYEEAKLVLEDLASFEENQTSTLKWQNLVKITFEAPAIYESENAKEIQPFSNINSPFSDFGYFAFNDKKYFLSNRVNNELKAKGKEKNYEESILNPFFKIYEFNSKDLDQQKDSLIIQKSTILENAYHLGPIFMNDSIFAYTYSSEKFSRSAGNLKFVNPQIRVFENSREIRSMGSGSNNFFMSDPFFSSAENRIYFSANFADSYGGLDIYYIEKGENGEWSEPMNCGSGVNSFGDERSPFSFGNVFYFSSNGRGGLGGFDIYKNSLDSMDSEPSNNMGIPYNSSKDDLFYFIDSYDSNLEVLTSDRDGGVGFDDIYYISKEDDLNSLEKVFKIVDVHTKRPLANTSIKIDSSDIVYSDSLGYSLISHLNDNSLIKFSKDNYFSKIIDISSILSSDSIIVELEKIDLDNSFAYFGIDSLTDSLSNKKQFESFLKRSVLNLNENPEYFLRYMIHSDSESIDYLDNFINSINQFLIKEGDFSGRINFLYFSNYYPLINKNITHSYSQIDLNNRLEYEIFKDEELGFSYLYPNFYYRDSTFFSLSSSEAVSPIIDEIQEEFIYISELSDLNKNTPKFSIILASLGSLVEAKIQQETFKKKYPGFNFDIISPTSISNRYRISVFNSSSLDEIRKSIGFYFKEFKIKDIWILEH
jgi:hypothetical protein